MMSSLITVVTCTLNSEKYLPLCLDSVKSQTYKNIEHVFVDGFSSDKTLKLLKDYISSNKDIKAKLIKSDPKGISDAMNIGVQNSSGDIIHFLHSDDFYYSVDSLYRAESAFDKNPNSLWLIGNSTHLIGDTLLTLPTSKILNLRKEVLLKTPGIISHENTFVKKEVFEKYGLFDTNFKINMDYEFWLRIEKKYPPIFADEIFTVFIVHKGSTSHNPKNFPRVLREAVKAISKNKKAVLPKDYDTSLLYKYFDKGRTKVKTYSNSIKEIISKFNGGYS